MRGVPYTSFANETERSQGVNIYLKQVTGYTVTGLNTKAVYDDNVPNGYTTSAVPETGIRTNSCYKGRINTTLVGFADSDQKQDLYLSNDLMYISNLTCCAS